MDRFELRYTDFSLSEDEDAVQDAFAAFYANEVPTSRVRAAQPLGHDEQLWQQLVTMGVATMALPEAAGGDGAGMVEMALVAELHGAAAAPAPLIEHVVASRLLATTRGAPDVLAEAGAGGRILTTALHPVRHGVRQAVPAGAVARGVLGLDGERLVLQTVEQPPPLSPNQGSAPIALVDLTAGDLVSLAEGPDAVAAYRRAVAEWKVLTAAALGGLTRSALKGAVDFVKTRETMGVPIGSLQGVAFPLTDVQIGIEATHGLALSAAWYLDHEPDARPDLPFAAFAYAVKAATTGTIKSAQAQGGLGFTIEADVSLYFLRAKGWSIVAGDPADDALAVGDLIAARL